MSKVAYLKNPLVERMVDRIARSICTSTCAFHNKTPCWSVHTTREDALEWPNPFCNEPGCHALAIDVYADVVPARGKGR